MTQEPETEESKNHHIGRLINKIDWWVWIIGIIGVVVLMEIVDHLGG